MQNKRIAIHLLLFAQLKELFGEEKFLIALPENSPAHAIITWLLERHPQLEELLRRSRLGINCQFASPDEVLHDGDEVAIITPVSGG